MFAYIKQWEFGQRLQMKMENKRWKRVEVRLEDHVTVPVFANVTRILRQMPWWLSIEDCNGTSQSRPMWEIHIIKYPTSHAARNVIFKLHHSLGDGFSLMGALLSCLQRVDNPSLPLTFPSIQSHTNKDGKNFKHYKELFDWGWQNTNPIWATWSGVSACWHRNNDFISRSY